MKPSPLLRMLLTVVPELPSDIRHGRVPASIYDKVLDLIAEHGSDEQREWSDLALIVLQDKALLAAMQKESRA